MCVEFNIPSFGPPFVSSMYTACIVIPMSREGQPEESELRDQQGTGQFGDMNGEKQRRGRKGKSD
jgi:hypothetical protein